MRKKLLVTSSALMLGLSSIACGGAYAIETSGIDSATDLKNCLTSASAICNLGADIDLTEAIIITGEVELNLGEYKIIEGNSFDHVSWGMLTVASGAELTINGEGESGIFANTAYTAIRMTSSETYDVAKTASLILNGGTLSGHYYGIVGNGDRHNTEIIINDGAVTGTEENDSVGIFHPQTGTITINGGIVTGASGIGIKSGTLNVYGGKIIANGVDDPDVTGHNSGLNIAGAALQVESNDHYAGDIVINLYDADLSSKNGAAFFEYIGSGSESECTLNIGAANFQGGATAFRASNEFESNGQPTVLNGYTITKDEPTVITTEKVADVAGLDGGESMHIVQLELDDGEDVILDLKEKGLTVEAAYEITIKDNGGNTVHETDNKITFSADVPSEPAEGYSREWFLYYIHNSEMKENTTLKVENGKLIWEADEFSTYILTYKDTVIPSAPDTGNFTKEAGSVSASVSIATAASAIFCGAAYLIKRALRR